MLRADLGAAVMLLTRVPAGWLVGAAAVDPARSVWAYPVVGAALGAGGAAVFALARWAGMTEALAAVWALVALALLTGALHEDGLADLADGFGGGRNAARKLEIMRDSRVGSYGVLAVVLATALRVAALAALAGVGPAMIVAGALSRAGMGVPLLLLRPARDGGLGASVGGRRGPALIGMAIAVGLAALFVPAGAATAAVLSAAAASVGVAWLARAQIGGFTGDVLGGCAVVVECAVLSALACVP